MTQKQLQAIKEMYLVDDSKTIVVDDLTIQGWVLYNEDGSVVELESLDDIDIFNAFKAEFSLL